MVNTISFVLFVRVASLWHISTISGGSRGGDGGDASPPTSLPDKKISVVFSYVTGTIEQLCCLCKGSSMRTLCEWRKTGGGNADAVEVGETVEEDTTRNCEADLNENDPDVWTGTSGVYNLATHMATTNGITLTKVRVVGRQQEV